MTAEGYEKAMKTIWQGCGYYELNVKYNSEVLARAKNPETRETDNRELIRLVMQKNPLHVCLDSCCKNTTRLYKEAVKRSLDIKAAWDLPPGDYKGT